MHEAKSVNTQCIKNLNDPFFGQSQWSTDEKSEVKVGKHFLVAELRIKMSKLYHTPFLIPALPGAFKL